MGQVADAIFRSTENQQRAFESFMQVQEQIRNRELEREKLAQQNKQFEKNAGLAEKELAEKGREFDEGNFTDKDRIAVTREGQEIERDGQAISKMNARANIINARSNKQRADIAQQTADMQDEERLFKQAENYRKILEDAQAGFFDLSIEGIGRDTAILYGGKPPPELTKIDESLKTWSKINPTQFQEDTKAYTAAMVAMTTAKTAAAWNGIKAGIKALPIDSPFRDLLASRYNAKSGQGDLLQLKSAWSLAPGGDKPGTFYRDFNALQENKEVKEWYEFGGMFAEPVKNPTNAVPSQVIRQQGSN